jgi:hypothetical protein
MEAFFLTTFLSRSNRQLQIFLDEPKPVLMQGMTSICFDYLLLISVVDSLQGISHWPGLNNFRSLHSTGEFADGTKFEDLSKV